MDLESFKLRFSQAEIVFDRAHIYYQYSKYLNKPETEVEKDIIQRSEFLNESRIAFIISTVLDLCILLDKKGDYSLEKLSNSIHSSNLFPNLIKDLIKWRIEIEKEKESIEKLFSIRDKHYAHLDKNRGDIMLSMPNYLEFESLFKLLNGVFRKIHLELYNADMTYGMFWSDNIKSVLSSIADRESGS